MKKTTIYDLANALNISVGTVNRALHNKPRINPETKKRILDMAEKMDFKMNRAAQSLRRSPIHIGCILCCPVPEFLNEIKKGMEAAFLELVEFNVYADIHTFEGANSGDHFADICELLRSFKLSKYNGVILFLSGDNTAFCPMISALRADGIETATVTNDIRNSDRVISVSADGRCAGRLAAELLQLCCADKSIAILTGSKATEIHRENIEGFLSCDQPLPFKATDIYEHNDQPDTVIQKVGEMFARDSDIGGIYINSASSAIACEQIQKLGYAGRVRVITTDLFDETKDLLRRKVAFATIFQDPYRQGFDVVKKLYVYLCDKTGAGQFFITPQVVFSSNMNLYASER